ncbi:MAG: hypothetical protein ABR536_01760 [Solirubrobacterales bacterium]
MSERSEQALSEKVYDGSDYRPFGELSVADARERAAALKDATGFGPTMRVRPVADGWRELADLMEETGAATVAGLEPDQIEKYAQKVWVLQPSGSFLSDPPPVPPDPPAAKDPPASP